jgi:hypothetical protein
MESGAGHIEFRDSRAHYLESRIRELEVLLTRQQEVQLQRFDTGNLMNFADIALSTRDNSVIDSGIRAGERPEVGQSPSLLEGSKESCRRPVSATRPIVSATAGQQAFASWPVASATQQPTAAEMPDTVRTDRVVPATIVDWQATTGPTAVPSTMFLEFGE